MTQHVAKNFMGEGKRPSRAPSTTEPEISLVVPAYRDAERLRVSLPIFRRTLEQIGADGYEIIVSDDGSHDNGATKEVTEKNGCRYVAGRENQGKGAAVRRGVLKAKGRLVLFTDSDAPYASESIALIVEGLRAGSAEVFVGDRHLPDSRYYEQTSSMRSVASVAFLLFVRLLLGRGWKDTQCGLKGFRRDVAQIIFAHQTIRGFAFDVEILYLAQLIGARIGRVPVIFRGTAPSHVRIGRDSVRMLRDLLALAIGHFQSAPARAKALAEMLPKANVTPFTSRVAEPAPKRRAS